MEYREDFGRVPLRPCLPMQDHTPADHAPRHVFAVLVVFAGAMGLVDLASILTLHDSFLPPALHHVPSWSDLGDWSAVNCYERNWQIALLQWAMTNFHFSDATIAALIVVGAHLLLWSGIFSAARALFGRSPWVAMLAVVLVRIMPDLFRVDLLSARSPSRMVATALVFWSMALLIRRRWIATCFAAGFVTHFSPTIGIWFLQVMVVALFCFDFGHGWRRSAIGAAVFVAIAAGPSVNFFVERILPKPPIPPEAMIGLHFFVDPSLSPFSVPLWAILCMTIYLAMAFVWMKRHFRRRRFSPVLSFLIFGLISLLVEIIFLGVVPVERAARFDLPAVRGLWLLWLGILYAPELADEIVASWRVAQTWRAILRALLFSLPVVWSAVVLIDRLRRPPRWSRILVASTLLLLALLLVLPHAQRPTEESSYALAIGLAGVLAVAIMTVRRRNPQASQLARSGLCALGAFAIIFGAVDGPGLARAFAQTRRTLSCDKAWARTCKWIRERTPLNTKCSIPWRPRQFRRWADRPVLANRTEVPADPSRRFEWFQIYAQTHCCKAGTAIRRHSASRNEVVERLKEYRRGFLLGASRRVGHAGDRLLISSDLVREMKVSHVVLELDNPAGNSIARVTTATVSLSLCYSAPPFSVYAIRLAQATKP